MSGIKEIAYKYFWQKMPSMKTDEFFHIFKENTQFWTSACSIVKPGFDAQFTKASITLLLKEDSILT